MKTIKLALASLLVAGLGLLTVNAQNVAPAKGKATTVNPKAQHLKKDGTPDMRYKENKASAGSTATAKPTGETKPAATATKSSTGGKSTKATGGKGTKKAAAGTTK